MKISNLKRILNPMEMTRALAYDRVTKLEMRIYLGLFLIPFFFGSFFLPSNYAPLQFSFSFGNVAYLILISLSYLFYLVTPLYFSRGKQNKKEYAGYFVSLNIPIVFISILLGFFADLPFMIVNGSFTPSTIISLPHFLLMIPALVVQPFLMTYSIRKIIKLKSEHDTNCEEEAENMDTQNIFDPIKSASDYHAGLISQKGLRTRKVILILSLLLLPLAWFLSPIKYLIYDIVSTIIFVLAYLGIPFLMNQRADSKDFYARLAVANAPIAIDSLIFGLGVGILTSFVLSLLHYNVEVTDTELFSRVVDVSTSIISVIFMTLAFKKYKP